MKNKPEHNNNLTLDNLASIRANKQLSVEDVAGQMKVSKDYVVYIESGSFEKLGAPTFLRGHITNYSKAIGVEPQEVLAQLPEELLQHQTLKAANALGASPLARVKRQSNHLGKYVIGTALLGMLCLSFYFIWDKWSLPQETRLSTDLSLSQNNDQDRDPIIYSSLIPQVVEVPEPSAATNDEALQGVASDSITSETQTDTINPDANTPQSGSATDDDLNAEAGTNSPIQTAAFTITLDLKEQAWVSIKTSDGDRIIQDLLNPGITEFTSDEPLQFRIGNAQSLELKINNETIELAPHTNKDVADFTWPLQPNS